MNYNEQHIHISASIITKYKSSIYHIEEYLILGGGGGRGGGGGGGGGGRGAGV